MWPRWPKLSPSFPVLLPWGSGRSGQLILHFSPMLWFLVSPSGSSWPACAPLHLSLIYFARGLYSFCVFSGKCPSRLVSFCPYYWLHCHCPLFEKGGHLSSYRHLILLIYGSLPDVPSCLLLFSCPWSFCSSREFMLCRVWPSCSVPQYSLSLAYKRCSMYV